MSIVRALRAKGHEASLGEDLTVVLTLAPGADRAKAETWLRDHELELRRLLVCECQSLAGVRGVFADGKIRKVRGANGEDIKGKVEVVEANQKSQTRSDNDRSDNAGDNAKGLSNNAGDGTVTLRVPKAD